MTDATACAAVAGGPPPIVGIAALQEFRALLDAVGLRARGDGGRVPA
jgi:hypothetical protein